MELDSRIIEGKHPLTCFDTEIAKKFIGKECYLSDGVASFANIDNLNKAMLMEVKDEDIYPYKLENTRWYYGSIFILPCEWVKPEEHEKKYRPFSIDSWLLNNNTGDVIHFRRKDNAIEHYMMFTGYSTEAGTDMTAYGIGAVILGGNQYAFQTLFESYEIMINGEWKPFGVLDDNK